MKKRILTLLAAAALWGAGGCAYVDVRTPYDDNLDQTQLGTKTGMASNYSVCWLVAWGDAGYADAAKDGGITVLRHADQRIQQYLYGVYVKRTIIVYGD